MATTNKLGSSEVTRKCERTFFFDATKKEICEDMIAKLKAIDDYAKADLFFRYEKDDWVKFLDDNPDFKKLNITAITSQVPEYSHQSLGFGGLNLLIHELKSKASIGQDFLCFACNSVEDFERALKKLKNSNFEGKISFLVRSYNFEDTMHKQTHITPVMIEKSKNDIKICIMDSIGKQTIYTKGKANYIDRKDFRPGSSHNLYVRINNTEFKNVKIFIADVERQKDNTNCSMFSFNDIKCFVQNDNFFEDLEKYGDLTEDEADKELYYINNLMPQHHRLTQSFKFLDKYFENFPKKIDKDSSLALQRSLVKLATSLVKSTREQTMRSFKREFNMKAYDRYYKFLHFIRYYAQKFPEDIQSISSMYRVDNLSKYLS